MAAPKVQVRELPPWLRFGRNPRLWVRPFYKRLAMGHIYAAFFLVCANRRIATAAIAESAWAGRVAFLNALSTFRAGVNLQRGLVALYIHVDDFGSIGVLAGEADEVIFIIEAVLRAAGFRWILVSYRSGNEAVPAHIVEELNRFAGPLVASGRGLAVWELPESIYTPEDGARWLERHEEWTLENVEQYGRQQGPMQ